MGSLELGVLFILGIGVFGGILGGLAFQKIKIPQVIGYMVIGLIIGRSGFKIIDAEVIETFRLFNFFALGIIGFLVGGELYWGTMKKYGKQFSGILIGEGVLSFLLVTLTTSLLTYFITRNISVSIALGIVFGAISSATDPASTMDVLWEYRGAGVLTTTIIAIIALDDALAMTLYGLGSGIAQILTGGSASLGWQLLGVIREIFGAILLGVAGGFILNILLKHSDEKERIIAFSVGIILIIISLAKMLELDLIFASMAMGITVRNFAPNRSKNLFGLLRSFSLPIYVFFFVLVGARLNITSMPWWMWLMVILYCLGRNTGKITGAWLGGRLTGAAEVVRKYTGIGLFAQGGVTIGLAIIASQHLADTYIINGVSLGETIVFVITATTLIFQVTGPPMVKLALKLSKEIGRNVTREDIMEGLKVADKMNQAIVTIQENTPLRKILEVLSENDFYLYPVVDCKNRFLGIISFETIKSVITDRDTWMWILADDLAVEPPVRLKKDMSLKDALKLMHQIGAEQLPVVDDDGTPVGILDAGDVNRSIEREIISMRGEAA
ncbi:MAG: sodium:proton exchanger [Spirochaetes bacterium]|nr:MAG: sodium:proton exchanger [Spirochaetota bacterium]